jgi:hypothetical protein
VHAVERGEALRTGVYTFDVMMDILVLGRIKKALDREDLYLRFSQRHYGIDQRVIDVFVYVGESSGGKQGLCCSMKICCTVLLLVCFTAVPFAQVPFLKKKDRDSHEPDVVVETLRSGSAAQRNQLATELGIMTPNFSSPTAKSNAQCVNFEHVDERHVRLGTDSDNAVIIAESSECDSTYIIVFDRAQKSEWRRLPTVRLATRVQPPEITFAELIQPGISEIVVHREITRDSGSAQQENFVVLKLLHDRLVPVLDTVERLELTMPDRPENDADDLEQSQQSTFRQIKAGPNSGANMRILEKEVLKERKTNLTRYRLWSWDPALERFRSSPDDGSEFAQAPPSRKTEAQSVGGAAAAQPKQN